MKNFYVTTPIYYPSGKFHIGTAYTTILADLIARYKRLEGYNVKLLTGMDEHGLKIQTKALEENKTPQEYVDEKARDAQTLWNKLEISDHDFIRTTDKKHEEIVLKIFDKFLANGDIYKGYYEGWYCTPCESFFTKTQLIANKCPDCGRDVNYTKEECYFFNMKKYEQQLLDFYHDNPHFLEPNYRLDEMINGFIKPGLEDLCISRSTFNWGIKLPNDPKHVMYVWLDALTNYITNLGYLTSNDQAFQEYWPANIQIIGKDIVRFHSIYWPIFLMALKIELPKKLYAHGFILMKGGKMSKSKGNIIYPDVLIDRYGVDAVRYILLKIMGFGNDAVFMPETFVERYNFDLCNDLGNLLNRTIAMVNKYFSGHINTYPGIVTKFDQELETKVLNSVLDFKDKFDKLEISNSLDSLWDIISLSNKYIDNTEPWVLAKDESKSSELASVMYHLVENLRIFAIYINAFMPNTKNNIIKQLGINDQDILTFKSTSTYGSTNNITVIDKGIPLFKRLNYDEEVKIISDMMA